MAQIDLRKADITLIDGYSAVGAVNQSSTAPANGDTSITVDAFAKAIPVGAQFTIAGSSLTFTVVSTTGGATPTAITFTPAIATASGVPADNAAVTIGGRRLRVKIGEGNLTFNTKRAMVYVREKRSIVDGFVMTGDDEPMEVKIDAIWEFLTADSGDAPTIEDVLTQTGEASAWESSGSDPCEPYAVDVEVLYTPPCTGVKREKIVLAEYRWESLDHDLKAGTISTSGKCKVLTPVKTRLT